MRHSASEKYEIIRLVEQFALNFRDAFRSRNLVASVAQPRFALQVLGRLVTTAGRPWRMPSDVESHEEPATISADFGSSSDNEVSHRKAA